MMDVRTIASNATEVVRKYMREQACELNARNCDIAYGHTMFDDLKRIDAYVYPYGENALRAFIVLSDSYGDVLNIHSDIVYVGCVCSVTAVFTGLWAKRFLEEHLADMWDNARSLIEERERVKRLEEIRDDVEYRATVYF